jgi:hypothetical protein
MCPLGAGGEIQFAAIVMLSIITMFCTFLLSTNKMLWPADNDKILYCLHIIGIFLLNISETFCMSHTASVKTYFKSFKHKTTLLQTNGHKLS